MKKMYVELPDGQYRDATEKESREMQEILDQRKKLDSEIEVLKAKRKKLDFKCDATSQGQCPLNIMFQDKKGIPYNIRTCQRCGRGSVL